MKRILLAGLIVLPLAFVLTRVFRSEREGEVRLTGVVSANEAMVASELSGRLRELRVNEGDWVRKGQVVAVLATEEIDAQRESQLAGIQQLRNQLDQGRERVSLERARVASLIDGATAQLRAVESQREEIRAELVQSKRELARTIELANEGLVPQQNRDRQQATVDVVSAKLQTAEDRVEAARAELELHRASERQVRVMEQEVEQTEARLDQARAELERVTVRLGYTELRSPLDGMVSVRVAREGEFVAAGQPVVTIVDLDDVWVRAEIEETLVTRVVVGQPLDVRLASGETIQGRVIFISPEAEFATQRDVDRVKRDIRTFGVKVAVPNPGRRVHPGMTAYVLLPEPGALPPLDVAPAPTSPITDVGRGASPSAPPLSSDDSEESRATKDEPEMELAGLPELPESVEDEGELEPPEPVRGFPSRFARGDEPPPAPPMPEPEAELEPGPEAELENDSLETLLSSIDLETATEEELERLEIALSAEAARAEDDFASEPPSAAETERTSPAITPEDLPPWARPRTSPSSPRPTTRDDGGCEPRLAPLQPEDLRLEGISTIDGKRVAIINGVRLFEGQSVEGARVTRIAEGSVSLLLDGRQITLTF